MRAERSLLFCLAVAMGAVLPVQACVGRPLDQVLASKVLRVVVYRDNPPFSWMRGNDVAGIDVDISRAVARRLGVAPEIIPRMTGEKVDDDLRFNVWKGPIGEGGVGDVMMHIPIDKELTIRTTNAVIGNGYFEECVALAINADRVPPQSSFDVFLKEKVGVQYATVADYFLLRYGDGALIENVVHYTNIGAGIRQFTSGETAAVLGVRSDIEGVLHEQGGTAQFIEPPMPGIVRTNWAIGTAVKEDSRDLGYAIGTALEEMRAEGEMEIIFSKYGVSYRPPSFE